jgi:hypothetical protein
MAAGPAPSPTTSTAYDAAVLVQLRARDLPGRRFAGHTNVHVGLQRGRRSSRREPGSEVEQRWAGDAEHARWELVVTVTGDDLRGPHVHGRRDDRYVYLSWIDVAPDGTATMFRRARLMFASVPRDVLAAAARPGWRLVGELPLTDRSGQPLDGAVRPPAIAWSAAWPV